MTALFTGVSLSATGFLAMIAVIPLVAEDLLGSAKWSGLPSSIMTGGTAFGTSWLAATMVRHGRRRGLGDARLLQRRAVASSREREGRLVDGRTCESSTGATEEPTRERGNRVA